VIWPIILISTLPASTFRVQAKQVCLVDPQLVPQTLPLHFHSFSSWKKFHVEKLTAPLGKMMLGASMEARLYTISTRCTGTDPGRSWMTPDCRSVRVHMLKRQCSARQATSIVGCGRLLAMTSWHPQLIFNFILDLPTSKIQEGSWEIRNSSDWRPERECLARLPGWNQGVFYTKLRGIHWASLSPVHSDSSQWR